MSAALETHLKAVITVPQYFKRFVDPKIDLEVTPKICCPFHGEDTPSFSYSTDRKVWSCFGACKTGGDVIAMHKKSKSLKTREEAIMSLASILGINRRSIGLVAPKYDSIDKLRTEYLAKVSIANRKAKTVEQFIELDQLLSYNKPLTDLIGDLDAFIDKRISN